MRASPACQEWLQAALSTPFAGTTVAVTHFAPSLRSADLRYGLVPGTAGFCNALDHLLPYAQLWLHGHLHAPSDYTVSGTDPATQKAWQCRWWRTRWVCPQGEQAITFRASCASPYDQGARPLTSTKVFGGARRKNMTQVKTTTALRALV